jgi:hypothetical protein
MPTGFETPTGLEQKREMFKAPLHLRGARGLLVPLEQERERWWWQFHHDDGGWSLLVNLADEILTIYLSVQCHNDATMIPQRFHNDSTTIPHDSTPAGVLRETQRTPESVPAILRASPPFVTTRKLPKSTNSSYFVQVAVTWDLSLTGSSWAVMS